MVCESEMSVIDVEIRHVSRIHYVCDQSLMHTRPTKKTVVEARARKISGEFPFTVGGRGPSDACFSHTYARVCEALRSN